ncbi:unnamed protein product [Peronospora belbahrii]|uniref:BTB domain-containing protein n=2 Tax=Peronospora belbahrii TaxID=622444 RepID=A0AAU9KPD9_9STRA|nr:unnamed protein product [Peronospora belbahrii]
MLFESNKMHRMARDAVETNVDNNANHSSIVPVLELSAFPEGAEMFEILAIYCYTGDVSFSLANVAAMHCAIKFLEMPIQFGLQPILYKEFASEATNRSVLVIACEGSCTYAIQNVLIQIAYQYLPSIVFNLMNQTKLLSAALFLYFIMDTRFSLQQCFSMLLLLFAAVLLSLAKDGRMDDSAISLELGLVPVLLASLLSGLGSALTQRSMQKYKRDSALVTIELSVYGSLFLMIPAIWSTIVKTPTSESSDANAWTNLDMIFEGCKYHTIIPVVSNALGGLLVGTVTKYVGGVLKSFALVCGIAFTAFVESYVYGAVLPNEVFLAAVLVAMSMAIYSSFPYVKKVVKDKTA